MAWWTSRVCLVWVLLIFLSFLLQYICKPCKMTCIPLWFFSSCLFCPHTFFFLQSLLSFKVIKTGTKKVFYIIKVRAMMLLVVMVNWLFLRFLSWDDNHDTTWMFFALSHKKAKYTNTPIRKIKIEEVLLYKKMRLFHALK